VSARRPRLQQVCPDVPPPVLTRRTTSLVFSRPCSSVPVLFLSFTRLVRHAIRWETVLSQFRISAKMQRKAKFCSEPLQPYINLFFVLAQSLTEFRALRNHSTPVHDNGPRKGPALLWCTLQFCIVRSRVAATGMHTSEETIGTQCSPRRYAMHRREQSTFALHEHVPRWFPLVSNMSPPIHRYIRLTPRRTMACPGYSTHALLQNKKTS
jgi:hypothetical protein